jgi:hypothetical protein
VSIGSGAATARTVVGSAQPRRAVIERAWRSIGPGVEVFSGEDGGPLRRTVKRIIDPLVLRLRSNTQFSAPVLDPAMAAQMHGAIAVQAPQLRAAAAWFVMLKGERRRQRITSGNAQELYFPVCFELAVTRGTPGVDDQQTVAAEDFFTDDTLDSDVEGLLAPHVSALSYLAAQGDPHVVALVDRCRELAEDIGLGWAGAESTRSRSDYALAAGAVDGRRAGTVIAGGVSTVKLDSGAAGHFRRRRADRRLGRRPRRVIGELPCAGGFMRSRPTRGCCRGDALRELPRHRCARRRRPCGAGRARRRRW